MTRDIAELEIVRFDHVVTAIRNQDLDTARNLLTRLEAEFPLDEDVYMWKAGVARTPTDAVNALERVLSLNPRNDRALRTLTLVRVYGYEAAAESLCMTGPPLCCKVCALKHAKPFRFCSACGSLHDISNLNGMLNNRRVIPRFLLQVVEDLEKRRSPDAAFAAAVGHLNLGRLREAALQVERSCERWPSEARFRIWRERLDNCRLILAIDDSKVVLNAVEQVLGRRGLTVRTAVNGEEALGILETVKPEAILIDNTISGIGDTRRQIRRQPELRDVPFITLSGGFFERMKGRLTGSAAAISKPFNAAELMGTLGSVVNLDARPEPRSWLRVQKPPVRPAIIPSGIATRGAAGRSRLR